jgi:putative transposase
MVTHIAKRHNKTLLLYHLVCPAKYRRKVFTKDIESTLKSVCLDIGIKYEITFIEIGVDTDHVHFLIQLIPTMPIATAVKVIKSITAKHIFKHHSEVKEFLWGGNFWTMDYYANTVGQYGNLKMIENYVKKQGYPNYTQIHHQMQTLFD